MIQIPDEIKREKIGRDSWDDLFQDQMIHQLVCL